MYIYNMIYITIDIYIYIYIYNIKLPGAASTDNSLGQLSLETSLTACLAEHLVH